MRLGLLLPQKLSALRLHSVGPSGEIGEHQNVCLAVRDRDQCGSHRSARLVQPADAAGIGAQRLHRAARAADEQRAAQHRGRAKRADIAVERIGPLQFELAHLIERDAAGGGVTRVRKVGTPAVPRRTRGRANVHGAIGAVGLRRHRRIGALDAQVVRHGFALLAIQNIGDVDHDAKIQRSQNSRDGQLLQRVTRRSGFARRVVAGGTAPLVDRLAGDRRQTRQRYRQRNHQQREGSEVESHFTMACMTAFSNSGRISRMGVWIIITATNSSLGSTQKCVP